MTQDSAGDFKDIWLNLMVCVRMPCRTARRIMSQGGAKVNNGRVHLQLNFQPFDGQPDSKAETQASDKMNAPVQTSEAKQSPQVDPDTATEGHAADMKTMDSEAPGMMQCSVQAVPICVQLLPTLSWYWTWTRKKHSLLRS